MYIYPNRLDSAEEYAYVLAFYDEKDLRFTVNKWRKFINEVFETPAQMFLNKNLKPAAMQVFDNIEKRGKKSKLMNGANAVTVCLNNMEMTTFVNILGVMVNYLGAAKEVLDSK